MRRMRVLSLVWMLLLLLVLAGQARGSGITNSGDDLRTGWYPNDPTLTPQLVSGGSFGQVWSASLEGQITAQPLLANGTLVVATEKDKTYGLDPATGAVKWSKSLGVPWNPADIGCGDITPSIGTVATPVVDPATNIAYMTHKTYASGTSGEARWYMDAISVSTGAEQPGFPVEISGSAQNASEDKFEPTIQMNRPGLLLMEGVVYAAFGSHCDQGDWRGWIFGVSTAGKITARYVANATETGAGIWQSGAGLTSDGPGTILFSTGNGGAPSQPAAGDSPPANVGESVVRVRVQPDGSLKPVDFFAPFEAGQLDENDSDFASGGVTGLPGEYFGTSTLPHLAVAVGKSGYVYLLNRDSLGGFAQGSNGSDNVIQRLGPRGGVWSRPGIWPGDGGYVYIPTSSGSSGGGNLDIYKYGLSGSGAPSLSLAGSSSDSFGWGSGAPVITSEGTKSGSALVWVVWSANRTGAGGQLRAYDPIPVSGHPVLKFQASIGTATNYSMPGIGDGRVYVANREGKVFAFGSPVKAPLSGPSTSFPTTTVGHSTEQTVTLTANEPLTVSSLSSSSSQFVVDASNPALPATLQAGQTIEVPITFTPTQTKTVAASLTVETSLGSSKFSLTGTGQATGAELEASAKIVSFPGIAVGNEKSESVTFTNVGGTPLTIESLELPKPPFSATGLPQPESSMAPGASVTVTVTFKPTTEGPFASTVGLVTSAGEKHVGLAGTAGAPAALRVSEESLQYGPVALGSTATKSFTITNVGGVDATITRSKPPERGTFIATTSLPEGSTIHPGESITEQVTFAPTVAGLVNDVWSINSKDTTGRHDVMFTGTGTVPQTPGLLEVTPEVNEYGPELVGGRLTKSFTITNTGGTAVPITTSQPPVGIAFEATTSLPVGTPIQPGESVTEQVTFAPTVAGLASAVWLIGGNDTSGLHEVQFTGTGTGIVPAPSGGATGSSSSGAAAFGSPAEQGVLGIQERRVQQVPDAELASAVLLEIREGAIGVRVSCPTGESICAGSVTLQISTGHRSGTRRLATLTLAFGSFKVAGGRVSTVMLHLSQRARTLLARRHILHARATVVAHDLTGVTHTAHATVTIRGAR